MSLIAGHFPWLPRTPKPNGKTIVYRPCVIGTLDRGESLRVKRIRAEKRRVHHDTERGGKVRKRRFQR